MNYCINESKFFSNVMKKAKTKISTRGVDCFGNEMFATGAGAVAVVSNKENYIRFASAGVSFSDVPCDSFFEHILRMINVSGTPATVSKFSYKMDKKTTVQIIYTDKGEIIAVNEKFLSFMDISQFEVKTAGGTMPVVFYNSDYTVLVLPMRCNELSRAEADLYKAIINSENA